MIETAKRRLREAAETDSSIEALRELVAQVEALVALAREVVVIEGDVTFSQQLMCAVERGRALVELADERRSDALDVEALKLAMGGVERLSRMSVAELLSKVFAPRQAVPAGPSVEEVLARLPPLGGQARLVDGQRYYLVHFEVLMPIESEDSASAEDNLAEAKRRAGLCAEMVDEYMGSGSNTDPYFYRTRVASVEPFNGELPWEEDELPAGYFVTVLSPGVIQVTGPEFRQTWPTRGDCVRAARDHARDGTVVSPNDDVE